MNAIATRAGVGLAAACLMLQGCPSAYQRTYNQQMQQLEMQQQAANAQAEAAHAQAQKYAAVVYFAVGSSIVDEDGQRELRWMVQQMQPFPQAMLDVQGFADSTGSEATNAGLSQQRAVNVAAYMNSLGIAPERMWSGHSAPTRPPRPTRMRRAAATTGASKSRFDESRRSSADAGASTEIGVAALVIAAGLAGCATNTVQPMQETFVTNLPAPSVVLVYQFGVNMNEVTENQGIFNKAVDAAGSTTEDERTTELAHDVPTASPMSWCRRSSASDYRRNGPRATRTSPRMPW